jgi:hypothetical protein
MLNLDHLAETTFYYPCSGRDWEVPLRLFGPHVKHLRFVDPNFRPRLSNHRGQLSSRDFPEWVFLRREITDDLTQPRANYLGPNLERDLPNFKQCAVSEVYQHVPTKHEITIHWHESDGRKTLDCFDEPIGVFFHRGDHGPCDDPSEGTSGSHWLSKAWLEPVIQRMVDGGLLVTDGSCGKEYPELSRFHGNKAMNGDEAVSQSREFTDNGVRFKCVGFAGIRYGPTLIWQIQK